MNKSLPWPYRAISFFLLVMQVMLSPGAVWAASAAAQEKYIRIEQGPAPVLTPKKVKWNKAKGKVTPPNSKREFSAKVTDAEIFQIQILPEPLVPLPGNVDAAENKALAAALTQFRKRVAVDDVSALKNFLATHPHSRWAPSLWLNLGLVQFSFGYFTSAFEAWKKAWELGKNSSDPKIKAIADHGLAQYLRMNARVGRKEVIEPMLAQVSNRSFTGVGAEMMMQTHSALGVMKEKPEIAFMCGPLALQSVLSQKGKLTPAQAKVLRDAKSPPQGFALSEVAEMAAKLKMDLVAVKHAPTQQVPVPCVVHWKIDHYGALTEFKDGRYHLQDPTFGLDLWITPQALEQEASGYFLISKAAVKDGWAAVDKKEAKTVFGRGFVDDQDDTRTSECDEKTGGCQTGHCNGMARYSFHLARVSLNIVDTPVSYRPAYGPSMDFTLTYNQRDAYQPSTFSYSNFGPKWTFGQLSYILDDPTTPSATVTMYYTGGGAEKYSGFTTSTAPAGEFARSPRRQDILKRIDADTYEREMTSGAKYIYGQPNGVTTAGRKVFLTQIIDTQGNTLTFDYDGQYRIATIEDATGLETTLSYGHTDPLLITKVTDPFSRESNFEYYPDGKLKKITDAVGITSEFTYGTNDKISSLITPYGTTTFSYVEVGGTLTRYIEATDPMGGKERVEYRESATGIDKVGPTNQVPSTGNSYYNDWLNARNTFYWDKKTMYHFGADYQKAKIYHWTHMRNPVDGGLLFKSSGVLESTKAPFENRVWYVYPGQTGFSYSLAVEGTSENRIKTARVLDDGTTQVTEQEYNDQGQVTKEIDPLGRTKIYEYHSNGIDVYRVKQKNGGTNELLSEMASYNSQHQPLSVTGPNGETTSMTYTAEGQIETITNAKSEVTTYTYYTADVTSGGNMVQQRKGRLEKIDGPLAGTSDVTIYDYDALGRLRTTTDSDGYEVTLDYDNLDRVTKVTHPDGTYGQAVYSRLDVVKQRDRNGRWTTHKYNARGERVLTIDPLGRNTGMEWCLCGALQKLWDPEGKITRWEYDIKGRVTKKVYPDNTDIDYVYENTTSRLKSVTDVLGQTATYTYNKDNTLVSIVYTGEINSTADVSFTYDPVYPRKATMDDGTGVTTYTFYPTNGALGATRLQTESKVGTAGYASYSCTHSYDELGRMLSKTTDGVAQSVTYDVLGRLDTVTNPLGTFDYAYVNATGRLDRVDLPNGQRSNYQYYPNTPASGGNGDQRLKQIEHLTAATGGTVISKFNYEYDSIGQITQWTQQAGSNAATAKVFDLGYDLANQLTSAQVKTGSTVTDEYAYAYDKSGNRTNEQVNSTSEPANNTVTQTAYNNLNQITSRSAGGKLLFQGAVDEAARVTMDANKAVVDGNNQFQGMVNVTPGTNMVAVVAQDFSGNSSTNVYKVVVPSSAAQSPAYDSVGNMTDNGAGQTYIWDATNRLTKITYVDGSKSEFFYDGQSRRIKIVEKNSSNAVTSDKRLIWCGNQIVEEKDSAGNVVKRFYGQGAFVVGASLPDDKLLYNRDHLGSIREVTDSTGAVRAHYAYDPYGRQSANKITEEPLEADFAYTGHYRHVASGLYLTLYRAYNPDTATWLSRDPIAEDGGINLYGYANDNPMSFIDKLGLRSEISAKQCEIVIYLGHGRQKTPMKWNNEPCSAGAAIVCWPYRHNKGLKPGEEIEGTPLHDELMQTGSDSLNTRSNTALNLNPYSEVLGDAESPTDEHDWRKAERNVNRGVANKINELCNRCCREKQGYVTVTYIRNEGLLGMSSDRFEFQSSVRFPCN
jgi:RHS repeat-associated protein